MNEIDKCKEILVETMIALKDKKFLKKVVMENMYIEIYKLNEKSKISKLGNLLLKGFKDKTELYCKFVKKDNMHKEINELFKKLKEKK